MKKKIISILALGMVAVSLTSCELPKGPDPDTMGSATRMMMGLPPKEREDKSDDVKKMLSLSSLLISICGATYVFNAHLRDSRRN